MKRGANWKGGASTGRGLERKFTGCKKEQLDYLVSTGKFEEKRTRGRHRYCYIASMRRKLVQSWTENDIIQSKKDRGIRGP